MYLVKDNLISNCIHINFSFSTFKQKSSSHYYYAFQIKNRSNNLNTLLIVQSKYISIYSHSSMAVISLRSLALFKSWYTSYITKLSNVAIGYYIELELIGLGYSVFIEQNCLIFDLNYSHFIGLVLPENIVAKKIKNRLVFIGPDREQILKFCTIIFGFRDRNIYKGKGIFFRGQIIRMKDMKKK